MGKTIRISCEAHNAALLDEWISTRGGVAYWKSINLSNPSASWSAPANTVEGKPAGKPNWQVANEPEFIETNPSNIDVTTWKEVKAIPGRYS